MAYEPPLTYPLTDDEMRTALKRAHQERSKALDHVLRTIGSWLSGRRPGPTNPARPAAC